MRNTHFGDGGFGFNKNGKTGGGVGGEASIDSERRISRKRGTKGNY